LRFALRSFTLGAVDLFRAIILGIVQGLSEFLPISSSGHLILVRALFRWPDQGLSFDVGLHLGTLLALLAYFWRDWWAMITTGLGDLGRHGLRMRAYRPESRLLWLLALGSLPAAITGLLFDNWIEENVRQPWFVAIMLMGAGTVLFAADRYGRRTRLTASVGPVDAVIIGLAQACALFPGVSRSGATMTAALFRGLRRDDAARFAFLLGTPAFVGAALLKSKDLAGESSHEFAQLAAGFAFSAVVGFIAIHFLLRFLRTRSVVPFVAYRYAAGVLTLVIAAFRVA
jgi:undecaprenyl-diphosphatase